MASTDHQECYHAFANEEYEKCVRAALPGIGDNVHLELLQVVLMSLQRLGKVELAEKLGRDGLRISAGRPWEQSLLRLTLGQSAWSEVVFEASSSLQRCQAYYYAGARSLTVGARRDATLAFLACETTGADCLERELAERALRSLAPDAQLPPDGFEVDRVRTGYEGVSGEMRLLRPKGSIPLVTSKPEAHMGGWLPASGPLRPGRTVFEHAEPEEREPRPSAARDVIPEDPAARLRAGSDTLRVFISSTFRDMHSEREVLVKSVFPRLRRFCVDRGLDVVEVDLRWGIPEELTEDILPLCFAEIDKCRYFVGLLGDRYGSVPGSIREDTTREHPWLKGHEDRSITELEITHRLRGAPGAAGRSFFYLRRSDRTTTDQSGSEPASVPDQERLKEKIRESGCTLRESYASAESVGQQILRDLTEAIERDHPPERERDPVLAERMAHESVAASHLQCFAPRGGHSERLDQHVRESDLPLMVVGEAGSGKSALLADWARHHREKHPEDIVVEHYVGATPTSADSTGLVRRLIAELQRRYEIDATLARHYELPEGEVAAGKLLNAFHNHLFLAMRLPRQRLVLVLDGLDQLRESSARELWWLPKTYTSNIKVLLSARPGPIAACARDRGWVLYELGEFTTDELSQAIPGYLGRYGKVLGRPQMAHLARAPRACQPLYLRVLLGELRVHGSHEDLDRCLAHYLQAPDLIALYERLFRRWQGDYDRPGDPSLVEDALCLLASSRCGLTENEWLALLRGRGEPLPYARWAPFFLALQSHSIHRAGLWSFAQDALSQAVERTFLAGEQDRRRYHRRLAEYFSGPEANARRFGEIPWHLQRSQDFSKLEYFLSDLSLTERFWKEGRAHELLSYWGEVSSPSGMVAAYDRALARAEAEGVEAERLGAWCLQLADLCAGVSRLEDAERLCRRALKMSEDHLEREDPLLAHIHMRLGQLLIRLGRPEEAEELLRAALHAKERALGPIHVSLPATLLALGEACEARGRLSAAERCHERALELCGFLDGKIASTTATCAARLALVLLRKKEFERAEELCRSVLVIQEQLPGADSPVTWQATDALAEILLQKERYPEAEALYHRILERRDKTLGPEHPSTAMTLGRLGFVRAAQGNIEGGGALCRRALDICLRTVGPEHPYTREIRTIVTALPAGG